MQKMTPERIAIHEAGHATLAIMKNVPVLGIQICDTPKKLGDGIAFGICSHASAESWLDSISISVAGAAAEAAHFSHPSPAFYDGSSSDFMKAYDVALSHVGSKLPAEFEAYAGESAADFLDDVRDGWCPQDIRGQAKRRLTLCAKRHGEASEFATELVHQEARRVMRLFQEDLIHKEICREIASWLQRVGSMTTQDVLTCLEGLTAQLERK